VYISLGNPGEPKNDDSDVERDDRLQPILNKIFDRKRREVKMAKDPGIGYRVKATITGVKGKCNAGHQEGDTFEISCHNPSGLCGFFYHDIFPSLSTFQFGGNLPWWEGDTIQLQCPDPENVVFMKLERSKRG